MAAPARPEGPPAGGDVDLAPGTVTPAGPPAKRYEAPSPGKGHADADPLRAGVLARLDARMAAARLPPVAHDERLDRVGNDLAVLGRVSQDFEVVRFLMGHYGLVIPEPALYFFSGTPDLDPEDVDRRLPDLRAQVRAGRELRVGVGIARRGGRTQLALVVGEQGLHLAPVPRQLPAFGSASLKGELLGRGQLEIAVQTPQGRTVRLPIRRAGATFESTFGCGEGNGRYQVEILAAAERGPEVLANFPIFCAVAPPRDMLFSPVASVREEDVRDVRRLEEEMFRLVNRDRAAAGLPALQWHGKLAAVARAHSEEMARNGVVAHVSPRTGDVVQRLARVGIKDLPLVAENVGEAPSVAQSEQGFMASPGHRMNVLHPQVTHVGVGFAARRIPGGLTLYVTQIFALVGAP